MTARERAQVQDLIARNRLLEEDVRTLKRLLKVSQNAREADVRKLKRLLKAAYTKRRRAIDETMWLHAQLLAHGIEVDAP
jgi:hypothetical protein